MPAPKALLICDENYEPDIFDKEKPYRTNRKIHYVAACKLFNPPFFEIVICARDENIESLKLAYNMVLMNGFLIVKDTCYDFFKNFKTTKKYKNFYMIKRTDNITYIPDDVKYKMPNVAILGFQKCNTSSISKNLNLHGDIYMCPEEIHYTDIDNYKGLKWFKSNFDFNLNKKYWGYKNPDTLFLANFQLLQNINPFLKVIISVRNPIDRAYSLWNMTVKLWNEKKSFKECIKEELEFRMDEPPNLNTSTYNFLKRGLYYSQIIEFLKFYPIQNIHLVISENFKKNPIEEYNKIYEFLNLEKKYDLTYTDEFVAKYDEPIETTLYEELKSFFKEDVKSLEKLFNIQTGWGV